MWGGRRIIVWGWQIERQKNKKMKYTVAFGRPPINNGSHNNQPKTGFHNGGEYGADVRRLGGGGGKRDTIILEALEVERLIKTKKNH